MIRLFTFALTIWFFFAHQGEAFALSSANIPLDSPTYLYLEKLAGMGVVKSDIWGIRPFSKAEAARLVLEAEGNLADQASPPPMARQLVARLKALLPRETALRMTGDRPPLFDVNPFASARLRYVHLDGASRSYERPVHDPGDDGVFGIGSGLRPVNAYPSPAQQYGVEGTPLLEGNEGTRYGSGHNGQFQFTGEGNVSDFGTVLVEPLLSYQPGQGETLRLNKGYLKLGSGGLELEAGRDAEWLGPGNRTAITLSNNPRNLDQVKLWSPEPIRLRYIGDLKYALILSRLDHTVTNGAERQPWFYAVKLAVKPVETLEIGFNLGRQQGGPGVNNSLGDNIRGLLGGTGADNSNSVAGFDLRLRLPWLRNTILYGEFSGEDTAAFWPIVESYVAGIYIPNLTSDGRNELRFEYYLGNSILSTNGTFPEGYMYKGMNLGPFQGGASQQLFWRYTHYVSPRITLSLDYVHTERGNRGRVPVNSQGGFDANGTMQAVERANAGRLAINLPLYGDIDMNLMYGAERIDNFNLVPGENRTNQLFKVDISYRY